MAGVIIADGEGRPELESEDDLFLSLGGDVLRLGAEGAEDKLAVYGSGRLLIWREGEWEGLPLPFLLLPRPREMLVVKSGGRELRRSWEGLSVGLAFFTIRIEDRQRRSVLVQSDVGRHWLSPRSGRPLADKLLEIAGLPLDPSLFAVARPGARSRPSSLASGQRQQD